MKQCIFLASNEGDLLIHAGISSLIREYAPEQRTVLILPKYPRVYRRADDYRHFFDRIIEVDGIYFTQNPKRLFRNILAIRKLQRSLIPYMNHLFFLFDVYTLVELVIYSWVRRQRDARLITVTAFEGDEIDFSNLRTSFIGTLSKSLYSLPLSGHLFFEYRVAKSENAGLNYFAGKCDLQLNINRSKSRNSSARTRSGLPYPGLFLTAATTDEFDRYKIIKTPSIMIFVESQIAHWTKDYWEKTNSLIAKLEQCGMTIYVKDHPNCTQSNLHQLTSKNIIILPKEISAEMLFINNRQKLAAVFGHGTTALVTASWLKIPAFDTSAYYAFSEYVQKKLSAFLTLGQNIVAISSSDEIATIELKLPALSQESLQEQRRIWNDVIQTELQPLYG